MTQPGYQQGAERAWWWKVAQHLDDTVLAATNAMAHNLDDPTLVLAFQETVRQAQAILFDIFRAKGLLPPVPNGISAGPPNGTSHVPHEPPMPAPPAAPPMPGLPMPGAAVPDSVLAAVGPIPFAMGVPSFPRVPQPPPGWPDVSAPPPSPPPPPSALHAQPSLEEAPPSMAAAFASIAEEAPAAPAAPDVFDYGDDAGKGFENQEVPPAPPVSPETAALKTDEASTSSS